MNAPIGRGGGVGSRRLGAVALILVALALALPFSANAEAASSTEPRIIDGSRTTIEQWPWQVALTRHPSTAAGSAYDRQFCGGSLLTATFVLTAAHCVFNDRTSTWTSPNRVAVVTGRTRLSSNEGQEISVEKIHRFLDGGGGDRYNPGSGRWDVVLLELASPSPSPTIKIAGGDESALWSPGRAGYVTGWGSTVPSGGGYPDALRVARVEMVSDTKCRNYYGSQLHTDVMVCAGPPEGDTCDGDSGGPLVAPIAGGGYRLVGDTSFGPDPCGAAAGVYGRLAADPIRSAVRNAVLGRTGIDVVGHGASPPPTPPPTGLTRERAKRKAWKYSKRSCRRDRHCRQYWAGSCRARGAGFRCRVKNYEKFRGRRYTCTRKVEVSERAGGGTRLRTVGRWKCRRRWR